MGLILKDKLNELMCGYPTVSDKYNVRGATLSTASATGYFGDIVKFGKDGYFTVASATNTISAASEVAGVLAATNVKLVTDFGAGYSAKAATKPGEAFNLMVSGYVALPVDIPAESTAQKVLATIKEGADAKLTAAGKVTAKSDTSGAIDMGWKFTGITCIDAAGTALAEVLVLPKNC